MQPERPGPATALAEQSPGSLTPAAITALLHRELPEGIFAGSESGVLLHLIDLTKACHAGGHEAVPAAG